LFEQDANRVPKKLPGAPEDQEGNEDADEGVGVAPAGQEDDERGSYGPHRADHVGYDVPEGPLHVEALAPRAKEDERPDDVHDEPHDGHRQHPAAENLRGLLKAPVGLEEDPDGDRHERHPVS
jgi:hypothetical protein